MRPLLLPGCHQISDGLLIGGPALRLLDPPPDLLARLAKAGIAAVVCLLSKEQIMAAGPEAVFGPFDDRSHEHDCPGRTCRPTRMEFGLWPLGDDGLPSADTVRATLDTMDRALRAQATVLVHGAGNPLRAVVAAGCWLSRHGFGGNGSGAAGHLAKLFLAAGGDAALLSGLSRAQRALIFGWPSGR